MKRNSLRCLILCILSFLLWMCLPEAKETQAATGQVTMTLNATGGTCSVAKKTVRTGGKFGVFPMAEKKGYVFRGWYLTKTGGEMLKADQTVTQKKSFTVYAQWISLEEIFGEGSQTSQEIICKDITKKKITLSGTSYIYNGKVKQPTVVIKDGAKTLKRNTDYKLTYANNKNVGRASVLIEGKGLYAGKITKYFTIRPRTSQITQIKNVSNGISLRWSRVAEAAGYVVHRRAGNGKWTSFRVVNKNTTVALTDTTAKSGVRYQYRVYAFIKKGTVTYKSSVSSVKTMIRLAQPLKLTASNASTGISLRWNKVAGADGYLVYRKVGNAAYKKIKTITKGTSVTYLDTGAKTNGAVCRYVVYAYKKDGKTVYQSVASASKGMIRLSTPAIQKIAKRKGSATVTYSRNLKGTGYELMYSTSSSFASGNKTLKVQSPKTVTQKIQKLSSGKKYYVRVRTFKKVGTTVYYSGWSARNTIQ